MPGKYVIVSGVSRWNPFEVGVSKMQAINLVFGLFGAVSCWIGLTIATIFLSVALLLAVAPPKKWSF
jgi:hypothetical protein